MSRASDSAKDLVDLPDVELVARLLDSLAKRDTTLRRLLMLAAVPRIVDAELLAGIAHADAADREFKAAYARLTALPYMKDGKGASCTLHADVRSPLLELWERRGFEGSSLDDARREVLGVWEGRYESACNDESALDVVGSALRAAAPERFRTAYKVINRGVERAMLELISATVAVDPDLGRRRLGDWISERAELQQYARCDLLTRAFAEAVALIPDPDERSKYSAWAAYYRSLAAMYLQDWERATEWLVDAEPLTAIDPVFSLWVATQQEQLLRGQNRLVEAQAAAESLITLNAEEHADPWNEHLAHQHRALILQQRWRPEEAAESYLTAVEAATGAGNLEAAIEARLSLALITEDKALAAVQVVKALASARLEPFDRSLNLRSARGALLVLGWQSPRLVSLLVQQIRQLTRGDGPHGVVDLYQYQAEVFERSGLAQPAWEALGAAIEYATELVPERVPDLIASRAALRDEIGQARQSAKDNLALMADPITGADRALRAQCLSNAALSLLQVTEAERSLELASRAHAIFEEMGNERAAAYMLVIKAEAHRRLGRVDEAKKDLGGASAPLPGMFGAMQHLTMGRVADAGGDLGSAAEAALRAYAISRVHGDRAEILTTGSEAMERAASAGRFADAGQLARELVAVADELTAYAAWTPSEGTVAADAHAAEAVRIWTAGIGNQRLRLRSAREHFAEALRLDPDAGWIHLEAGLIERAAGERLAAVRQLNQASLLAGSELIQGALAALHDEFVASSSDRLLDQSE